MLEDVCRYDKRRLDIFNDDSVIVYEHRERLTQFLEIPRVLVLAYMTRSIFDFGLDHVICFVQ